MASNFLLLPITTEDTVYPVESELMSLVSKHLQDGKFWFSYEWDITRSLQSHAKEQSDKPMWATVRGLSCARVFVLIFVLQADDRFFWNKPLQGALIQLSQTSNDPEVR